MSEALVNAYTTHQGSAANREDIHDKIMIVEVADTPAMTLFNKNSRDVGATSYEWTTDAIAAPDMNNANVEAFRYEFDPSDTPTKVNNKCQIFDKTFSIAKTQDAVKKVGRTSDVVRMRLKRGKELKVDIEAAILQNKASVAGSGAVARELAGLPAWLSTNASRGTGGSAGGYNSGTGIVDAATNGTQRTATKTLLDDALQAAYTEGGNPTIAMVSPQNKRICSTFMSDANVSAIQTETSGNKAATLIGAVDAYRSDFGLIDFVPNKKMPAFGAAVTRNIFLIDPGMARMGWLRKIQEDKDVQSRGDSKDCAIVAECTLIVDNEKAHAVLADTYGLSATT